MSGNLITFFIFILTAFLLHTAQKKGYIDLGKWDNIVTITLAVVALISLIFPINSLSPSATPDTIKDARTELVASLYPDSQEVYYDNFSSVATGWDPSGYTNGWFGIHLEDEHYSEFAAWKSIGTFDSGIILQVDVLGPFKDNDKAERGLGFGSDNGDIVGAYAFTINAQGECEFYEYYDSDEYGGWELKASGIVENFDRQKSYHNLIVHIANYREVIGYVDGDRCANYVLENYTPGYVGVFATASLVGVDYAFGDSYFDEYHIFRTQDRSSNTSGISVGLSIISNFWNKINRWLTDYFNVISLLIIVFVIALIFYRKYSYSYLELPLEQIANSRLQGHHYYDPPTGAVKFGGIPFKILSAENGIFNTNVQEQPNKSAVLKLEPPIRNVSSIFVLINSGNSFLRYKGETIGTITLDFADDSVQQEYQLVLGENIREWAPENIPGELVDTVSTPLSKIIWEGWTANGNEKGNKAIIDQLELPLNKQYSKKSLKGIKISRTTTKEPQFLIFAITVKKRRKLI